MHRPGIIHLRRETPRALIEAMISPIGASIQSLTVDGVRLLYGSDAWPVAFSGALLLPWPNRVRNAQWSLTGDTHKLEVTEPRAGNALHGLVSEMTFAVADQGPDFVSLTAVIRHAMGYPYELDVSVTYSLTSAGINSTISTLNRGAARAPVAVGVHPYAGPASGDRLGEPVLAIEADRTLLLDDDDLPTKEVGVASSAFDVRGGRAVSEAIPHACYSGLKVDGGRISLQLRFPEHGYAVEVWGDEQFRWAQIYVASIPELGADRVVALEPMTAPPDALNSGDGIRWLDPGERWFLNWGARAIAIDKERRIDV